MVKLKTTHYITTDDVEELTGKHWGDFEFAQMAENDAYQVLCCADWYLEELYEDLEWESGKEGALFPALGIGRSHASYPRRHRGLRGGEIGVEAAGDGGEHRRAECTALLLIDELYLALTCHLVSISLPSIQMCF